jgi:hypothetical protein
VKAIVSAVAFVCVACGSTQASPSASTATPTSSASAIPTALAAPVSLSGTDRATTGSFTLPSGHLAFNMTGSDACGYQFFLVDPLNRPSDWNGDTNGIHSLTVDSSQQGQPEDIVGFLGGTYQAAVDGLPSPGHAGVPCPWTFTFRPVR